MDLFSDTPTEPPLPRGSVPAPVSDPFAVPDQPTSGRDAGENPADEGRAS
jgi:hypothetical protein